MKNLWNSYITIIEKMLTALIVATSDVAVGFGHKETAEYIPDFVIDDKIIVEIKALEFLSNKFIAQLVNYLKGTNFQLGYLVNFGAPKFAVISHD